MDTIVKRVRERPNILSYFTTSNGWFWRKAGLAKPWCFLFGAWVLQCTVQHGLARALLHHIPTHVFCLSGRHGGAGRPHAQALGWRHRDGGPAHAQRPAHQAGRLAARGCAPGGAPGPFKVSPPAAEGGRAPPCRPICPWKPLGASCESTSCHALPVGKQGGLPWHNRANEGLVGGRLRQPTQPRPGASGVAGNA